MPPTSFVRRSLILSRSCAAFFELELLRGFAHPAFQLRDELFALARTQVLGFRIAFHGTVM